jgi:transposase
LIFAGVDWAEARHDVHVQDEQSRRLAGGRLPDGVEGIARFPDLVAAHADDPGEVVVGIETDRSLFVAALLGAGYQVFAVNPMSVSRYRDRRSSSTSGVLRRRQPQPGPARSRQPPSRLPARLPGQPPPYDEHTAWAHRPNTELKVAT